MSYSINKNITPVGLLKFAAPSIIMTVDIYVVVYYCRWNIYFAFYWK